MRDLFIISLIVYSALGIIYTFKRFGNGTKEIANMKDGLCVVIKVGPIMWIIMSVIFLSGIEFEDTKNDQN